MRLQEAPPRIAAQERDLWVDTPAGPALRVDDRRVVLCAHIVHAEVSIRVWETLERQEVAAARMVISTTGDAPAGARRFFVHEEEWVELLAAAFGLEAALQEAKAEAARICEERRGRR